MVAQQSEYLAGWRGKKFADPSLVDHPPLGVRAGETDHATSLAELRRQIQRTEYLSFLAAHEIGRIEPVVARQPGYNRNGALL